MKCDELLFNEKISTNDIWNWLRSEDRKTTYFKMLNSIKEGELDEQVEKWVITKILATTAITTNYATRSKRLSRRWVEDQDKYPREIYSFEKHGPEEKIEIIGQRKRRNIQFRGNTRRLLWIKKWIHRKDFALYALKEMKGAIHGFEEEFKEAAGLLDPSVNQEEKPYVTTKAYKPDPLPDNFCELKTLPKREKIFDVWLKMVTSGDEKTSWFDGKTDGKWVAVHGKKRKVIWDAIREFTSNYYEQYSGLFSSSYQGMGDFFKHVASKHIKASKH